MKAFEDSKALQQDLECTSKAHVLKALCPGYQDSILGDDGAFKRWGLVTDGGGSRL